MRTRSRWKLVVVGVLLASLGPQPNRAQAEKEDTVTRLRTLLSDQADAWNRGDIEGFMKAYWNSSDVTFSSSSGTLRGWQALLDRYRRQYPDRAAMGHLDFDDLKITPLASDAAFILGHWRLLRKGDHPGGVFTLVARRFPEGWRIIHDHTSATPDFQAPKN